VAHGESGQVVVGFAVADEVEGFHAGVPRPCAARGDSL
jgi:hypothetical protein